MSTQQTVTPAAKAAPKAAIVAALWLWLAGTSLAALAAVMGGGRVAVVASALALAAAPAFAGFVLAPYLGRRRVDAGLVAVWLLASIGLTAGSGGVASPLAASLLTAPAWALVLGRPWAPEAGAGAVLGFALAAWVSPGSNTLLGPFAELMAVVAMAMTAGLMAIGSPELRVATGKRVAEVSHELRTPLTHILGFSEMIERQMFGAVGERYVEYAGLIRRSGTHLLGLVNDLLDISKIEAGRYDLHRERFDVRAIVEEVVRVSIDSAEKKAIVLGLSTPERPLYVYADPQAIRRMLINTVGNAIKFTPRQGRVMVSASVEAGRLLLDTSDTGPGFPETGRDRFGAAYERGDTRVEGAGLGLSLVRALAELHGGSLEIGDVHGGGARVRISLPVLAAG